MALATMEDSCREYACNAGQMNPEMAWINTPFDTWERNPFYTGPPVKHPEDDSDLYEHEECDDSYLEEIPY